MSPLPRGVCPVCGRVVALRKGDLVREHRPAGGLPDTVCPGSGKATTVKIVTIPDA